MIIRGMTRKSDIRRFVQIHLLTVFGVLAGVGLLNMVADPFDFFRPDLNGRIDPYKKRAVTRYARPNAVAAGNWDVIFCGASRTEIGLDPEHPVWEGRKVYNFGLTGAKYSEIWWAAHFALEENPGLESLWVELDPSYLIHLPYNRDFVSSRYAPQADLVNYSLGQLWGSLSTERSVSTLSKWLNSDRADDYYTAHGLRKRPCRPPTAIPWDWFEAEMAELTAKHDQQTAAHRAVRNDPDAPWLDLELLDNLPDLIARAEQQGTQVCVIIPPSHVVRLAQLVCEGSYGQINAFKRRLAALAGTAPLLTDGRPALRVYDFLVDDDANAEALPRTADQDTRWHWEAGHFRAELGERMIRLIAAGQPASPGAFGAPLTPETIDDHLTATHAALARRLPALEFIQTHLDSRLLVQRLEQEIRQQVAGDRVPEDVSMR